jgi:hypothetical protein
VAKGGLNAATNIFEAAVLEGESACPDDISQTHQKSHIGVSYRDAFEVIVIRGQKIEEVLTTVPIEDYLTVAGGLTRLIALMAIVIVIGFAVIFFLSLIGGPGEIIRHLQKP